MKYLLPFFLLTFCYSSCNSQCEPALKSYANGFDTIEAQSFSFLDDELKDIRIVGYGEDTHGTAEFTMLTQELMKYLSEKHDFKILIIETGFGEGLYLNDYIQGKRDDIKTILSDHNSTWRYNIVQFYQLMNWLRDYNKLNTENISIYGCEMQYVVSDVNRIHDYLSSVGSDYKIEGFDKHLWQTIEEDEKVDYFNAYANLKKHFIDNHEIYKAKSSDVAFNMAFHHIEVLGQFVSAINQNIEQRKHDLRDIYMGENIEWLLNLHGPRSKALYWAHNAHVGDWINNGIVDVTGHQLRKRYGDLYFNIATDFGTGDFIAFPADANQTNNWKFQTYTIDKIIESTFTKCLQELGSPNTFLNLREARQDKALFELLHNPITTMSGAGAQARSNPTESNYIGKAFDAIIYLDRTNKIQWAD